MSLTEREKPLRELLDDLGRRCDRLRSSIDSTDRIDRAKAETAIRELYTLQKLEQPTVLFAESPWQAAMMLAVLQLGLAKHETVTLMAHTSEAPAETRHMANLMRRLWIVLDDQTSESERLSFKIKQPYLKPDGPWEFFKEMSSAIFAPNRFTPFINANRELRAMNFDLHRQLAGVYEASLKGKPHTRELGDFFEQRFRNNLPDNSLEQVRAQVARSASSLGAMTLFDPLLEGQAPNITSLVENMMRLTAKAKHSPPDQNRVLLGFSFVTAAFALSSHDFDWLPLYQFLLENMPFFPVGPSNKRKMECFSQVAEQVPYFAMMEKLCVISGRPSILRRNQNGRIHSESGPALAYRDGFELYSWHGSTVPKEIIEDPDSIKISTILVERNSEVRRVMIDRYGASRFIIDSGAEKIHEDDCGVLYRKTLLNDEPLVMVKVINSTPEPDGSRRTYFLRVPPHITTAREAVAWTFELPEHSYQPDQQT